MTDGAGVPGPRVPLPTFDGTPPFPIAARAALADDQLRRNLKHATTTIRTKRARAVAERDDWEELRLAGAAIKDEVLARLPELLERLEANVTAAGGTVHWARDAAEANAIVTRLVQATGATEVVKVKSMTTQEIELNEALAQAGIDAWETDLAELIVQLGHDLPSHILVPAIHRNRSEIRDIFRREMAGAGRPAPVDLTDDPAALAEAARLHLREKFLRARVAISGANFAVAETGTVMVVESEGNGRMCLTLPDTLITVLGIEKLVPTWRDLEVFLQLLPRSSTAERMNPYTSMWTGVTPGDGPQAFHLILLDNGRTDTLSDPVGRQALRCIKCSACLNVCPVYERTGGRAYGSPYPGPHRGDPDPPVARHRHGSGGCADGVVAVRVVPVRRVLRGLPRAHRHPRGAGPPADPGRPAAWLAGPRPRRGGSGHALDVDGVRRTAAAVLRGACGRSRRAGRRARRLDPPNADPGDDRRVAACPRHAGPGQLVVPALVAQWRARGRRRPRGPNAQTDEAPR